MLLQTAEIVRWGGVGWGALAMPRSSCLYLADGSGAGILFVVLLAASGNS